MSGRISYWQIMISTLATLMLTIVPLPQVLQFVRPDWLLLLVIYWSLNAPMLAGQTYAFLCGLLVDTLQGTLLGQHALAFVLIATLTQHFQLRVRVFPLLQQAMVVLLFGWLYQFVLFWTDGIIGLAETTWWRWLPALIGALVWPLLVAVLDTSQRRYR